MRKIQGKFAVVIDFLYVAFVAWSLYAAVFPVETHTFRMMHLAFMFGLAFLVHPPSWKAGRWSWWLDLSWAILGVASIAYALVDLDQFIRRSTLPEPMDVFFGLVAIVLLLELSRRVVDTTFTLVVLGSAGEALDGTSDRMRSFSLEWSQTQVPPHFSALIASLAPLQHLARSPIRCCHRAKFANFATHAQRYQVS